MTSRVKVIRLLAAILAVGLAIGFVSSVRAASPVYVRTDGDDTYCDGTADAAYPGGGPGLSCAVQTIQKGVDLVDPGGTVYVRTGTYVLSTVVNLNKAGITLDGDGAGATIVQVSGTGDRFDISADGVTLKDFEIQKTDKSGEQNIIRLRASNPSIVNNTIHGQFVIGDGDTTRAIVVNAGAFTGLNIEGNIIYALRQPAYISGTHTGTIQSNYVYGTKGWVLEGGDLTFTGNTWGAGADVNVYDIAILATMPGGYYTDIVAMSNANNGAVIEDQRVSPAVLSAVYVDAATSFTTDLGGRYHPYSTITPAIARVVAKGTIYIAAGTYTENPTVAGKQMNFVGATDGGGGPLPTVVGTLSIDHTGADDGWRIENINFQAAAATSALLSLKNLNNVSVSNCTFDGAGRFMASPSVIGVNLVSGPNGNDNVTIEGSTFQNGLYVSIGGTVDHLTVRDCTISTVKSGLNLQSGGVDLVLEDTSIAVIAQTVSADTYGVRFASTDAGSGQSMTISGGSMSVIRNGLVPDPGTYHSAIIIRSGAAGPLQVHGVSIDGDVDNLSATVSLDAECNYWQTTDYWQIAPKIRGLVDWSPWSNADFSACTYTWPVHNVTQVIDYQTIQAAIDDAHPGDTIQVDAGTYVEDPVINKALTLLGPNAGINPNTGVRVPEAVILPAVSAPDPAVCEVMAYVSASGVTIKGFTFDGDNPALTSGVIIDGADVDACEIIAGWEGVGSIVVENNILAHSTYSGIDFYNYTNPAATSGNYIRYNRLEDIGETTYNWGVGLLVYNNFYADITDNVLDGVRTGIQTGNFYLANPGTTGSISNNEIGAWRLGIFHNLAYSNASPLTISGNTITAQAYPGATKWNGLLLSSIGSAVTANITGNTISIPAGISYPSPNYTAGYNVWNVTTSAPIAIEGGTVTGGDYGVFVNNYEGYSSDAGNTAVALDGVVIAGSDVAGVYVKDSPSNTNGATVYADIENCDIDTDATGILVEGADASAVAHSNKIAGNPTAGLTNTSGVVVNAEHNWWGAPCGPTGTGPDSVSADVDYTPWWSDEAMTIEWPLPGGVLVVPAGATTPEAQAILDCAAPGSVIRFESGSYPGGLWVNNPQLTIQLNNCTVGAGSPAFTIVGDDEVIQGAGTIDGGGGGGSGIVVNAGADNFILENTQVTGWDNGVELSGDVTSFKVVGNWIHSNAQHGLLIDAEVDLAGVVTIEGNLFKVNGGNGIQHSGNGTLPAEYNSWGDIGGYGPGDGIGGLVDAGPYTYIESFFDVYPNTLAVERHVPEEISFDVALKADAVNVYGLTFKFTYDTDRLLLNSITFAGPWAPSGRCFPDPTPGLPPGTVSYVCQLYAGDAEWNAVAGTIATFNFTALTLPGDAPLTTDLDISHLELDTSAGAIGGQKIFMNNAGFNLPSATERDITDTNDGRIIVERLANYTGFIDLQGRTNDSGALFEVHATSTYGSLLLAQATSASSGAYTTSHISPNWLGIGNTYWFQVNRTLYLPTTALVSVPPAPPGPYVHSKELTAALTALAKVTLLGGDATDDEGIQVGDLSCIGGDYGGSGVVCGATGWSDVNGDGKVNVQDLSMAGGNLYKTSSPWIP